MKKITFYISILSVLFFLNKDSNAQKFYATTYKGGNLSVGAIIEYNAATGTLSRKISVSDFGLNYCWGDLVYHNFKFYGTVSAGPFPSGLGVIFEYDPFTNAFVIKQTFNGTNGADARCSMVLYNNNFYGMTYSGGANGVGTIFEWDPATNVLTKKIDLSSSIGCKPYGSLTLYNNVFYGMTSGGGANNMGVIFQWSANTNIYNKKYDFTTLGQGGAEPHGNLSMYNNKFYGMTRQGGIGSGIIFEWDPAANVFTKKINLSYTIGRNPYGSMTLVNNKFYGMTTEGDSALHNKGVLFEYNPATNVYTKKHDFDGTGAYPDGTLLLDGTKLYGMTTRGGGLADGGTVFEYTPTTNVLTYKAEVNPSGKNPLGGFARLPFVPEVDVKGNNATISDGDITPNTSDYTDFGNASLTAGVVRRFVIKNTGEATLSISGINISGADASSFAVQNPPATVGVNDSNYLYIRFLPGTTGLKTATVTITNDDPDEGIYDFALQGTGMNSERGLAFDGNDHVVFNPNTIWNFNSGTLEFWAKPTYSPGAFKYLIANSDANFVRWAIYMNHDRQGVTFWNGITASSWFYNLTQNNWYHFAFVQSGNSIQCYINGNFIGTQLIGPSGVGGKPFSIGNIPGAGFGFVGSIDEVRYWSSLRSQSEIIANHSNDVSQQAGLLAYYRFDHGTANGNNTGLNTALDFSGNCLKGTLNNFTLTGSTSNWTTGAAINVNPIGFSSAVVKGNGIVITDGSTTPQLTDNTDFENTSTSGSITKYFTLENNGTGDLFLTNITFSGPDASLFSAGNYYQNSWIGVGQSTSFKVTFTPNSAGLKTANLNINNNDCDHLIYDFAVQGNAFTADRGLSFNGTNSYLRRDFTSSYQLTTATWEMWMKAAFSLKPYNPALLTTRNNFISSTQWSIQVNGGLNGIVFTSGTISQTWNYELHQNQWYHIAVVSTGGSTEVFVNGISIGTKPIGPVINASTPFLIGQTGSTLPGQSNYFQGSLDDIRIWNVVRTQSQIHANMNSDIPQQSGLIGYHKFDQGIAGGNNAGTTDAFDYSGNCNLLALNNFDLTGTSSNFINGAVTTSNTINFSEIEIRGNGISIADGDITSDVSDGTNFGNTSTSGLVTATFKIHNSGDASLAITSASMSGTDASMFIMGAVTPASPVPPQDSAIFTITFAPASAGVKNATLTITNNDCSEGSYGFAISGTGITPERGLSFDGVDDRVSRNNNGTVFEFGANATWELWMKPTFNTASGNPLLVGYRNINSGRWSTHIAGNRQGLHFWNGSTVATWNYSFNQNQWYHIAFVQSGSSVETFVNGSSLGTRIISSSSLTGLQLLIGSQGAGEHFQGSMDDIRIWNVAKTQSQIQANMNTDISQQTGLVAYYRFDQGIANGSNPGLTNVQDYSGYCYNAIATNFLMNGPTSNWTAGGLSSSVAINFPDINLQGNSVNIPDGSSIPNSENHTDFGSVLSGGNLVRTFIIQNTGAADVTISSIIMSGADASLFTPGALMPAGSIAPSDSATFTVTFAPTSEGLKTAIVNINNYDCDEGTYDFTVQGTGASSSYINITIIPEGFYNIAVEKLNTNDTVKVYLHSGASPFAIIDSATAVIDSLSFTGSFKFDQATSGTYYIRLKHRNTIETWSKSGGEVFTSGTTMSYNFTNYLTQAFGSNMKQVDAVPLRFGIYSGDVNQDGVVDATDNSAIDNDASIFRTGYIVTDLTGDGVVDASDAAIADNNSANFVSVISP